MDEKPKSKTLRPVEDARRDQEDGLGKFMASLARVRKDAEQPQPEGRKEEAMTGEQGS